MSKVRSLVDAQAAARQRVNDQTRRYVERIFAATDPGDFYDEARVNALAERMAGVVRAGQTQTARITDAYLAAILSDLTGEHVGPAGIAIDHAALRNGITPEQTYARLGPDFRFRVSEGLPVEKAAAATQSRALNMTAVDLTLAMRDASKQVYENAADVYRIEVSGYRRVIHPEFAKDGTCGLCAAASDQIYHVSELMPIHNNCSCETLPIVNDRDPGRSLNQSELGGLYTEAGSTKGADLKRVRVRTNEHGELGPVLTDAEHSFRSPRSVPETPLTVPETQVA